MAGWNGSGIFSKTHSWVADAANAIKIRADRHDANDVDFTNGINNCLTKDGQNSPSGNLPMGSNKHTGVADGTSATDYLAVGQFQSSALQFGVATGSANAFVLSLTPSIATYATGQTFRFQANHLTTGATTIDIDGLGVKSIKLDGLYELSPYAIKTNQIITIIYDGTQFQPLDMSAITGDIQMWSSSTTKLGWLQLNGTTTIGSLASAAGEAADANEGLWKYLYDATDDAEAAVSGGRTTRDADWTANKTLTLPETDDLSPYGIGSTLTKGFKTSGATTVTSSGSVSATGSTSLSTAQMPAHTHTIGPLSAGVVSFSSSGSMYRADVGGTLSTSSTGSGSGHNHSGGSYSGSATSVLHPVFGIYFIIKV